MQWWMVEVLPDVQLATRVILIEMDEGDENLYLRCVKWNFKETTTRRFNIVLKMKILFYIFSLKFVFKTYHY